MPIYRYKCDRCSADFELKQSFDDKPRAVCHVCGGEARRLFIPVPIVFKGSGFYITDHRAENSNKPIVDKPVDKKNGSGATASDKSTDSKSKETKSSEASSS